jgi:superfamily II DNA/RNA helicase
MKIKSNFKWNDMKTKLNSAPGARAVMIATEAMARTMTIQQFCSVVVVDLPEVDDNYLYEIGRNRVEGTNGVSIVLATDLDGPRMLTLAQFFNFEFQPLPEDRDLADIL